MRPADVVGSGGDGDSVLGSDIPADSVQASLAGAPRLQRNPHWQSATHALEAHGAKRRRRAASPSQSDGQSTISTINFDECCSDDVALAAMPLPFDECCSDDVALAAMPLP